MQGESRPQAGEARLVSVGGVVQGVGFRPFVYNLASRLALKGWVLNHSGGVEIVVEGPHQSIEAFLSELAGKSPPLAHIDSLVARPATWRGYRRFEIRQSEEEEGRYQLISPDVATCSDCRQELLDPGNRRFRYPFTNCTNCGPRFTIISDIPYDRSNTTMRAFPMCEECQREYDDPANRRFHAQPNACPICGPHIWLVDAKGRALAGTPSQAENARVLELAREMLMAGKILAVKGLGGFHLACDATNDEAVGLLRQRKGRPHKPFALMMTTLDEIREHCYVSESEEALLTSVQCPIVLLKRRPNSPVGAMVAPGNRTLGVMLPYTPLHHILLRDIGRPLVMTSGNLSEEPIVAGNAEALSRLAGLADGFLLHNRDIHSRYDDSVWHVLDIADGSSGQAEPHPQPIRRARGYAPFPVRLPIKTDAILAAGPALKNTFCLSREQYAFISQHIGDLETVETLEHFKATVSLYQHLFRLEPAYVVADQHPDYLSTHFAREYASSPRERRGMTLLQPVQHHHAHIASCIADNGWGLDDGAVIGVALDGTGYGEDGHIWGGEWFVGDYKGFRRAAHLEYLPLPGGDAAIRHPWRIAAGYLHALAGAATIPQGLGPDAELSLLVQQIDRGINAPLTSSMGRLFDAVSALLGVCREASYEAQAAIELEQCAEAPVDGSHHTPYEFKIDSSDGTYQVRIQGLLMQLLEDQRRGTPISEMAWRFHQTVAEMILQVCLEISCTTDIATVALSGGCFQSRLLTEIAVPMLRAAGFRVLLHRQIPCNDGGLSLGQAILSQFQISQ